MISTIKKAINKSIVLAMILMLGTPSWNNVYAQDGKLAQLEIDGDFKDWESIPKVMLNENNINQVGAIWSGEEIYLYVLEEEFRNGAFTWNSFFELQSDLGRKLSFRCYIGDWGKSPKPLDIQGVTGATGFSQQIGNAWAYEIKLPMSGLGKQSKQVELKWSNGDTILTQDKIGGR